MCLIWGAKTDIWEAKTEGFRDPSVCLTSHAVPSSLIALGQHLLRPEILLASRDVLPASFLPQIRCLPHGIFTLYFHSWCGSSCGVRGGLNSSGAGHTQHCGVLGSVKESPK